ncbi:MAG TPA: hypothetical protein VFW94_23630 [Candidatus Acidoferrales bacterium]|nr:hypothetical protein [Candidatus Acidoferrales bacterium]
MTIIAVTLKDKSSTVISACDSGERTRTRIITRVTVIVSERTQPST